MLNIVVDITDTIFRAIGIVVTSNWIAKNIVRIVRKMNGGKIMIDKKETVEIVKNSHGEPIKIVVGNYTFDSKGVKINEWSSNHD